MSGHRLTKASAWRDYLEAAAVENLAWDLPQVQAALGSASKELPVVWDVARERVERAWARWMAAPDG